MSINRWVVIKKMFKDISLRKPQGVPINRILGCNKEDVQRISLRKPQGVPIISLRKPQGVPINRILGCNKEDVQRYHETLRSVCKVLS